VSNEGERAEKDFPGKVGEVREHLSPGNLSSTNKKGEIVGQAVKEVEASFGFFSAKSQEGFRRKLELKGEEGTRVLRISQSKRRAAKETG